MSNTNEAGPLIAGQVTFIQNHLPPLDTGEYQITVQHEVQIGGAHPQHETFQTEARFAVAGERFRMDPAELDSAFPPADGQGDYFNVLPHLVVTRRTLPWERTAATVPPKPGDGQPVAPWLALLLFDNADPIAPPPAAQDATVADLLPHTDGGQLPAGTLSYPITALNYGEALSDPCRIIDLPLALFQTAAPSLADLPWLAHARRVQTANKASTSVPTAPVPPETDYAVLIGNRVPTAGQKSTVHLVSLEAMEPFLPAADGTPSPQVPAGTIQVRLVTFHSWSFDTVKGLQTFSALLEGLSVGTLQLPDQHSGPAADSAAEQMVRAALGMGYTALNHLQREGGQTVTWYRGPLVPYAIPRLIQTPVPSADAVLAYDPSTGLLDSSCASAWALGRLLGLQSRDFALSLYSWKTATRRDTIALAEQHVLCQRLQLDDPPPTQTAAAVAANRASVVGFLKAHLPSLLTPPAAPQAESTTLPPESDLPPVPRPADLVGDARRIAALHDEQFEIPPAVTQWLARLRLLHGVPYAYLVPDEAMLPPEALRFFHLDFNWLDCLTDGAYSLGRATAGDQAHDMARAQALHRAVPQALLQVRQPQAPLASADDPPPAGPQVITGFLLRSAVVAGWPGLGVNAYGADGAALTLLRLERLAPTVLLCLCDGVVDHVDIHEAPEGLHFGLDMPLGPVAPDTFFKKLRSVAPDSVGNPLAATVPVPYRAAGHVLRVAALAGAMATALGTPAAPAAGGAGDAPPFTAAEFALEMVEGVALVRFANQSAGGGP